MLQISPRWGRLLIAVASGHEVGELRAGVRPHHPCLSAGVTRSGWPKSGQACSELRLGPRQRSLSTKSPLDPVSLHGNSLRTF